MPYQRVHQKGVDLKQDKTEVAFFLFGHNVTHVLRQSLTSFSVFKQGTRLSKSPTSRHTFPTRNLHIDLGLHKQEVSHLLSETTFLGFFFVKEKCIVNNVEWKIQNDNIAGQSFGGNGIHR